MSYPDYIHITQTPLIHLALHPPYRPSHFTNDTITDPTNASTLQKPLLSYTHTHTHTYNSTNHYSSYESEYNHTKSLLLSIFPPWCLTPPPEFYHYAARLRHDVYLHARWNGLSWFEEVERFFVLLRPVMRGVMLMPWEGGVAVQGGIGVQAQVQVQAQVLEERVEDEAEEDDEDDEEEGEGEGISLPEQGTAVHIEEADSDAGSESESELELEPEPEPRMDGVEVEVAAETEPETEAESESEPEFESEPESESEPEPESSMMDVSYQSNDEELDTIHFMTPPATRRKPDGDCMICLSPLTEPDEESPAEESLSFSNSNSNSKSQDYYTLPADEIECELYHYQVDSHANANEKNEQGEDGLVWCKAFCGNNYHGECFRRWLREWRGMRVEGTYSGRVTCPSCRRRWRYL